jgi:multiple sugar transport system substrate-binding protein
MRRIVLVVVVGLVAAAVPGCGGGSSGGNSATAAAKFNDKKPVTLTVWSGFTGRELGIWNHALAGFQKLHPNVTIKSIGSIDNNKIVAGIRSGSPPDVALSFETDKTGEFCSSGGWIDLGGLIKRDHVDMNQFPQAVQSYSKFGDKRCAMPVLADTYGLYYNKDMFKAAGISSPPKTFSELTADAKKLTQRNSDGSIKVAGFVPNEGFYENAAAHHAPLWDAQWTDGKGKSSLATSPGWANWLTWDKRLVDWYGHDKLQRFIAGAGQEFSPQNAFERGKVAMLLDGEYRTAFIKAEHPELNYGTAPMPVDDAHPELYGAGYVVGNTVGIPKGAKNQAAAWELIKYLATNNAPLVTLADGLGNVPTTAASAKAATVVQEPRFQTFVKIFQNPHTATNPLVASGDADQLALKAFAARWEAGKVPNLHTGLQAVDKQIDAQLANATAGTAP